jgi:hypothetical protein
LDRNQLERIYFNSKTLQQNVLGLFRLAYQVWKSQLLVEVEPRVRLTPVVAVVDKFNMQVTSQSHPANLPLQLELVQVEQKRLVTKSLVAMVELQNLEP